MTNDSNQMHPEDKHNLIIFVVAALAIWIAFDHFMFKPTLDEIEAAQEKSLAKQETELTPGLEGSGILKAEPVSRQEAIAGDKRLTFDNGTVFGTILLQGGRIDDLSLHNYYQTLEQKKNISLFSPRETVFPRYADIGWLAKDKNINLPDQNSVWRLQGGKSGQKLTPGHPVTLYWNNGQGVRFERVYEIDEKFVITVTQNVINNSEREYTLFPYAYITEHGIPKNLYGLFIIHEGPIGYIGRELLEISYKDLAKEGKKSVKADKGWIGFTERYWLTSLIPDTSESFKFRFAHADGQDSRAERYQVDMTGSGRKIMPGDSARSTVHIFAGAKQVKTLGYYEKELGIKHFDLAVDFGMYYFLTKPFFYVLTFFGDLFGNYGIAIIILTIIVKTATFPLTNKFYKSMAKLKQIAPKMHELREKHGEDKQELQQQLIKLYEREKVNPMGGCLPMLVQIPIFFALYKVLQISIEIRHAPFFGWIEDLSTRDPTAAFNLFGLMPWDVPEFLYENGELNLFGLMPWNAHSLLTVGVWPCLMLMFMLLQRRLNPPPQDKQQAMMVNVMPYLFTYILSRFSSGLVIYWTFSNALGIIQQYIIMRSMGVPVSFLRRPKAEQEMAEMVEKGPSIHPGLGALEDEVEEALFDDLPEADKENGQKPPKKAVSPPKPKKKKKKK